MKITIIKPLANFNDEPKGNQKFEAIVDGNIDGLVASVRGSSAWLVARIENHVLQYDAADEKIQFVPWQFLGKPKYERLNDDTPQYITGTVLYVAVQNGKRKDFEETFEIQEEEGIVFDKNACPMRYREEIKIEAIRLADMMEIEIFKQELLPRNKRSRDNEGKTTRIFVPRVFLESWFGRKYPGGWKSWWYKYTPEHTRTLADDMKAVGLEIEEV